MSNFTPSMREKLFPGIKFETLADDSAFKEDSVREEIIVPILKELGYDQSLIVRSKALQHPFIRIGSKKRKVTLIPDYCLKSQGSYAWVLDAKSPNEKVTDADNISQVYIYASHDEIKAPYFALCNGTDFAIFRRESDGKALLSFKVSEIDQSWHQLQKYLSPESFHIGKEAKYESTISSENVKFDYATRQLLDELPVKKQQVRRHFGVHAYFTRQSWNVVQAYIMNFTKQGDIVLDPFGGTGVTAIESLIVGRKAINVDINPLAVFMVSALVAPISKNQAGIELDRILKSFKSQKPQTAEDATRLLGVLPLPADVRLPSGSDVPTLHKLFTEQQMAELALLKSLIKDIKDKNLRDSFLLMFSGVVTKFNLTYHSSSTRSEGGGTVPLSDIIGIELRLNPRRLISINFFAFALGRLWKRSLKSKVLLMKKQLPTLKTAKLARSI